MFNLNHPFFIPMWRRVATTAFILAWALFELSTGAVMWAILFAALGAFCIWSFFFNFNPERE